MFGDANSSSLQEEVLDLTDRIYNSWITWVNIKILKHHFSSVCRPVDHNATIICSPSKPQLPIMQLG